jgi:hypothetical protein
VFAKINAEHGSKYKLHYSLLSDYLSVASMNKNIIEYDGDFMPYSDRANSYWTGYYSSYPVLKSEARRAESVLRTANLLYSISPETMFLQDLEMLREIVSDVTHHDGITGTSKKTVVNEYYLPRLRKFTTACQLRIAEAVQRLVSKDGKQQFNFSSPNIKNDQSHTSVVVFNGLGWHRDNVMVLPIQTNENKVCVLDIKGRTLDAQVMFDSHHNERLMFSAYVPALGFSVFSIKHGCEAGTIVDTPKLMQDEFTVETNYLVAKFCKIDGTLRLCNIQNLKDELDVNVNYQYLSYISSNMYDQSSGAYVFRPQSAEAKPLPKTDVQTYFSDGPICKSVEQVFNGYLRHVHTLCQGRDHIYTEITIGGDELPADHEIVTRIGATDISSDRVLYCDKNGLETRRFEFPKSGSPDVRVAASFLPMTSVCFIRNTTAKEGKTVQLSVLSNQAMGAASTVDGHMEFMLYRLTRKDDGKGLDEVLSDKGIYTARLHIRLTKVSDAPYDSATVAFSRESKEFDSPFVMLTGESTPSATHDQLTTPFFVLDEIPSNVHLLSLDTVMDRKLSDIPYSQRTNTSRTVLRLQHMGMGGDVTVNLERTLANMDMFITEETTLSTAKTIPNTNLNAKIMLKKNEIRTFIMNRSAFSQPNIANALSTPKPWVGYQVANYKVATVFSAGLSLAVAVALVALLIINLVFVRIVYMKKRKSQLDI